MSTVQLVATVSDLHLDYEENRDLIPKIAGEIYRQNADVIVVAGDLSHQNRLIRAGLRAFRAVCDHVLYVPGNHELWEKAPEEGPAPNAWVRYREDLRALAESEGVHYLPHKPWRSGNLGIAGTCGWYDGSLMLPGIRNKYGADPFADPRHGMMWRDKKLVRFFGPDQTPMSDEAVTQTMADELRSGLDVLHQDSSVDRIIAVTHHVPFFEAIRRGPEPWEMLNAYLGSRALGQAFAGDMRVICAVYGHTHVTEEHRVKGLRVYGTPLGYPKERKGTDETAVLRSRIGWIRAQEETRCMPSV